YLLILVLFFFFFEAEDGIRDRNVTGVQTCALPILYKQPKEYMQLSHIKMGICLELSSHALRDIEQNANFTNWFDFFQTLKKYFPDARFARIDIASDFFKDMGHLSAEGLHRLLKNKRYFVKLSSRSAPRYQGLVRDHKDVAETVYINK